eukprot:9421949-Lingulodinium_polyedra.AAC.1
MALPAHLGDSRHQGSAHDSKSAVPAPLGRPSPAHVLRGPPRQPPRRRHLRPRGQGPASAHRRLHS